MKKTSDCSNLVRDSLFRNLLTEDSFNDVNSARHCLLRRNFLRKFNDSKICPERTAATYQRWIDSERKCFEYNSIIGNCSWSNRLGRLLDQMRILITSVIGLEPPVDLFERSGRWTPGASFNTRRGVHYSVKMDEITVTPECSLMLDAFKGLSHSFTIVRGNRMSAVPKTIKVDRLIAIEPSGNAFLQGIVGTFFKKRLLSKANIDLYDQTINQDGAFRAVVDGLCTIDLESASDSMCTELVRAVLPHHWFTLLDELRSKVTFYNGKWRYLDKFSSMGNGYTFELETLIFWACCKTIVLDSELMVYGDDIIVEQRYATPVVNALEAIGFTINREKSFFQGSYFESCGKHYYDLEEVTPVFQKEPIIDIFSAFRAHNRLVRWSIRNKDFHATRRALKLLRSTFGYAKCLVPFGSERDDGWLVDPRLIPRDRNGDFKTKVAWRKPLFDNKVLEKNCYLYKLYAPTSSNEDPRGYPKRSRGDSTNVTIRKVRIWASALIG